MRRPRMSLGSWIFASVLVAVLIPTGAWAATSTSSPVHLTNAGGTTNVGVTPNGQLLTAQIAPVNVVRTGGSAATGSCVTLYTPPAGKAFVLTSVTYLLEATSTSPQIAALADCANNTTLDSAATSQTADSQSHAFPSGLPTASLGVFASGGTSSVYIVALGYLVPAAQLPPTPKGEHLPSLAR